uniref:Rhodanese domain-containing protein n=1 Tax=Trypanosoma congolense (strain IL3000) TaxID=1068625 RepID=G0V2L6_TRYCI|nr:hypothetical protein, unlikely [Trypanosoma congolense IL3000]
MGQGTSYEDLEQRASLNKFHMHALLKSKKNGGSKDVFIIDVREPFEVERYGTIPFATHMPSSEVRNAFRMSPAGFKAKYKVRMPKLSDKIVFFDQRQGRAAAAADMLQSLGYKAATFLADGYGKWSEYGGNEDDEDL